MDLDEIPGMAFINVPSSVELKHCTVEAEEDSSDLPIYERIEPLRNKLYETTKWQTIKH